MLIKCSFGTPYPCPKMDVNQIHILPRSSGDFDFELIKPLDPSEISIRKNVRKPHVLIRTKIIQKLYQKLYQEISRNVMVSFV